MTRPSSISRVTSDDHSPRGHGRRTGRAGSSTSAPLLSIRPGSGLEARGSPVKVPVLGLGRPAHSTAPVTFPAPDSMASRSSATPQPCSRWTPRAGPGSGRPAHHAVGVVTAYRRSTSTPRTGLRKPAARPALPARLGAGDHRGCRHAVDYSARPCADARCSAASSRGPGLASPARTSPPASPRPPTSCSAGPTIPKGTYTLWTLPAPTGWKLIFNKQTKAPWRWRGLHRTDARPAVGHRLCGGLGLRARGRDDRAAARPAEQFTIAVLPQGKGGVIRMDWENTRISIPFTRKQP